ncbi:hypothetical protein SASPL_114197 [Salvia splendens]|uniref:V-type proton ATPase subunit C n=1 Tax=Salvia splendens TaxID=180675 RepID=A0A8X9A1T2_SALSN|nr:hypothetical protein SASPL_114197 [Salvia splendens]
MTTRYWTASLPVGQRLVRIFFVESPSRIHLQTSLCFSAVYCDLFAWDEAKYPTMSPLKEIVDGIHVQIAKIEDDLKVRGAEYSNVRSQLNVINRKQAGRIQYDLWCCLLQRHHLEKDICRIYDTWCLAVRDLSNLVKPQDIVTSERLITLLAVVSKYSQKDWLSSYETLTEYVVPRSSKKLHEDNEYALYTVTLFNRVADNFRTKARERSFQVRSLACGCTSALYVSLVKAFCDTVLPPSSLSVVLSPSVKNERKVRSILEGLCSTSNTYYLVPLQLNFINLRAMGSSEFRLIRRIEIKIHMFLLDYWLIKGTRMHERMHEADEAAGLRWDSRA